MKRSAPHAANTDASRETASATPRVCLLAETFHPVVGGGERHALLLARHLNALGMSAFVLTRRSDPKLPRSESVNGVPTYRVPPARLGRLGKYAMIPFVARELLRRRSQYDIILVCGFRVLGAPAVLAARWLGKACVLRAEAEGEMSGRYASAFGRLPMPIVPAFRSWICVRNRILRTADGFVSISGPVTSELSECGVCEDRVFALPNGVDSELFRPVDGVARRLLRERLGLPIRAFIAAYSGKLNRGKGLEHLLKAWVKIAELRSDAHLILIGAGGGMSISCEDELRRFAREAGIEGRVTFTGYVENVHEYLQASNLFVFPTESEAFGLSLVEAMACGLPVIASRVGGIPEIVTHARDGMLVKPADPDALVREIIFLMEEPSAGRVLSANARRTVCERYSIEAVASRYYEMFSALSARRGGR